MPVQLGVRPDHSFNEPLGLLSDCHRRIEQFLDLLIKVNDEAGELELSPVHRDALQVALRYFSVAAPKHTQDEEASLFPRLRDVNSAEAREAMALGSMMAGMALIAIGTGTIGFISVAALNFSAIPFRLARRVLTRG